MNVTRRTFLQRTTALLAALGVVDATRSDLVGAIARDHRRRFGAEAAPLGPAGVKFLVEIPIRAGFQFSALFPTAGQKLDTRVPSLNFYSSQGNVDTFTPAVGQDVYFARYTAGAGADRLRARIAAHQSQIGIATSHSVTLTTAQHTSNFVCRSPNAGAPCPTVLHAATTTKRVRNGVSWNNSVSVVDTPGTSGLPGNAACTNATTFMALFDRPMYFTVPELQTILGRVAGGTVITTGGVQKLDALFAARNVAGTPELAAIELKGRELAQTPPAVAFQNLRNSVATTFTNSSQSLGGTKLGDTLAYVLCAFALGYTSSVSIALDSSDWEADIPLLDDATSKQGIWNLYLGSNLANFIDGAAALPDPDDPSKSILDSMLISITSEFSRVALRNGSGSGSDNSDGGTQAFAFIGSKVKTGAYGNLAGDGTVVGFDPVTGALSAGSQITEAMMYRATGQLLGLPDATLDQFVPGIPGIPALVR